MKVKGNVSISQCPDPFIGRTKSQNSFRARQRVEPDLMISGLGIYNNFHKKNSKTQSSIKYPVSLYQETFILEVKL